MDFETLGGAERSSYVKWFILLDMIVIGIMLFATLGIVANAGVWQIYFYVVFLLALGTVPSALTFLNRDKQDLPIDTVTLEEDDVQIDDRLANWRVQVAIGLALSVLIGYNILTYGGILVQYPSFAISVPFLTGTWAALFNATIAALASGYVETRVFWSFLMPTAYNLINRHYDSVVLALAGSTVATTGLFTVYHLWVYSTSIVSLQSVMVFGLINCLMVIFLRSVVSNALVHFTNNWLGSILNISRSLFGIAL